MIAALIEAEADRLARYTRGATEREDLVGCGWLAYLTASRLTGGGLRLRIRGAMQDALRREWQEWAERLYATRGYRHFESPHG